MKDVKFFRLSKGQLDDTHDSNETPCANCKRKFAVLLRVEGNQNDSICMECYGYRFGSIELTEVYKKLPPEAIDAWGNPLLEVKEYVDFEKLSVPQLMQEKINIEKILEQDEKRLYEVITKKELENLHFLTNIQRGDYLLQNATIGEVYQDTVPIIEKMIDERPYTKSIADAQKEFMEYAQSIADKDGFIDKEKAIAFAKKKLNEIERGNLGEGEADQLDSFTNEIENVVCDKDGRARMICPRCSSNNLKHPIQSNARSRIDNETWICSECGIAEALDKQRKFKMNERVFRIFLNEVIPKDIPHDNISLITDWLMVQYLTKEPDKKFMKYFIQYGGNLDQFNKLTDELQNGTEKYVNEFRQAIFEENYKSLTAIGITPKPSDKIVYERREKVNVSVVKNKEAKEKKLESKYLSFEEARQWALDQKCHSRQDWINLTKTDDFPKNIPIHPDTKYKPDFHEKGGFPFFCGYTQKVRRAPLTQDRVLEILQEFEARWDFYQEYTTGMVTNWFDTQGLFSVKDPYVQDLLSKLTSWKFDPEGIEALRYWCRTGDFEKKFDNYQLQGKSEEHITDYLDRIPTQVQDIGTISGLLEKQATTGVEKIMLNARMVVPDETDKAWYDQQVEFCVRNIMTKLFDPELEKSEFEKLQNEPLNGNPFHDEILTIALKEYEFVKNINYDKKFYTFPNDPTLLQKYHAYKMRTKNCFFNMSGTGQKKTGASVIGAIACKCQNIIVIAPNNIVPQWIRNIRKFYSNAFVFSGKNFHNNFFVSAGKHIPKFHVINYDKFGRNNLSESFIKQIGSNNIDMIIFDEGQLARKRDDVDPAGFRDTRTNKRKNLEKLVDHLRNNNRTLKVCMLSATPIINSLSEGKSLLEILTGTKYGFSTRNTPRNANKLHTEFIPFSIVYNKKPDLIEVGRDKPIIVDAYLPENLTDEEIMQLNWMELEQIATKYRIPKIIEILKNSKGKTVIYTDYVTGIVPQLREACINAGYKVGEFTGSDKSGMIEKTGFKDKEGNDEVYNRFVKGDLDVLIASRPFQVGIDEVQFVCNNLILNGLVWTYAEFEQIIGRVSRDGSNFDKVNIHVIMARLNEYEYDLRIKYNRIQKKRALGDCVRFGTLPDELDIPDTKGERLRALKTMIQNKESGFPNKEEIERKHAMEAEAEIESKIKDINDKFAEIGINGDENHG